MSCTCLIQKSQSIGAVAKLKFFVHQNLNVITEGLKGFFHYRYSLEINMSVLDEVSFEFFFKIVL